MFSLLLSGVSGELVVVSSESWGYQQNTQVLLTRLPGKP